jgi:hypothetical protein
MNAGRWVRFETAYTDSKYVPVFSYSTQLEKDKSLVLYDTVELDF